MVPATFRQPDFSDPRLLIADSPGATTAEIRLATKGLARSDPDYPAAALLTVIARDRWQALAIDPKDTFVVSQDAHVLPGMFLMEASVNSAAVAKTLADARIVLKSLVGSPFMPGELEKAKSEALGPLSSKLVPNEAMASAWLDAATYSLSPVDEQMRTWNAVSAADLQRVAARLFREVSLASVVVGKVEQLKIQLGPTAKIEVLGEAKPQPAVQPATTNTAQPAKPPVAVPPKNPIPFRTDTKPLTKPG